MKLIVAIIRPFMLDEVRTALLAARVSGLTLMEVKGFGHQRGNAELHRGSEYDVHFVVKLMLNVAVTDDDAPSVVQIIRTAAHTGNTGDGKIFVLDLDEVMRIRTGETGDEAI